MLDLFRDARWDELYAFFMRGYPPLMAQLMALNTIVFMLFIARRMRGAQTLRAEAAATVQTVLLFANMLALFQENIRNGLQRFF